MMLTNAAGPFTRVGLDPGVPTTGIAKCALGAPRCGTTSEFDAANFCGRKHQDNICVTVYDLQHPHADRFQRHSGVSVTIDVTVIW